MKHPIHAINWFEIPVHDFNRAKKFYSTLYAYEMKVMVLGPEKMGILPMTQNKVVFRALLLLERTTGPMQTELKLISMETPISILY